MEHSRKRRRSEAFDIQWGDSEDELDLYYGNNNPKSSKTILLEEKFIYTIGNEIHFTCDINKASIQEIIKQMTQLIHDHKKNANGEPDKLTIVYIVDSPGGSVTSILKFVDFVEVAKTKYPFVEFISIITGLVASAGTIMAIVADKRFMTKNAHAMIHELSSGNSGKYTELRSYVRFLDHLHDKLTNIYCKKTGKSLEEIEKLLKNETWFSAEDYLKYGFIDELK